MATITVRATIMVIFKVTITVLVIFTITFMVMDMVTGHGHGRILIEIQGGEL